MTMKEINKLSNEELDQKIYLLKEELFHLRRRKAVGQLEHAEQIRTVRKDIARLYTAKRERELHINN